MQDIENPVDLKITPLQHHKDVLLTLVQYGLKYNDSQAFVFKDLSFELRQGERVFLNGKNGCGKSSLIKSILMHVATAANQESPKMNITESGMMQTASNLTVSYINQDTSFLKGSIKNFCSDRNLEESLFCAILRQLDMERIQFTKNMEDFSEGQKKKVLIAASLLTPAHLYIWDEPLNYIDIFSRMQIEKLLLEHPSTMLIVEHDVKFQEKIATKIIDIG